MKISRVLSVVFVIVMFAGCVSSKEYKSRLDDIDGLKKNISDLDERLKSKEAEKVALEAKYMEENENLKSLLNVDRNELKSKDMQISDLKAEIASLSQEKSKAIEEKDKAVAELKKTYTNLVDELKSEIQKGEIAVTQLKDKLSLSMVDKILFDSGSAEVKKEGKNVLDRVAEILKKVADRQIRIEGHTDDVPIGSRIAKKYPTNWELSNARATNVVKYLHEKGIDPKLLSPGGYAEYRPVVSNETEEGKAKNRRIEIVLIPLDADRIVQ